LTLVSQKMREYEKFDLIIDGAGYSVDEALFNACREGDTVVLTRAPRSGVIFGVRKAGRDDPE